MNEIVQRVVAQFPIPPSGHPNYSINKLRNNLPPVSKTAVNQRFQRVYRPKRQFVFPKSISEFSNEEFQDIYESFRKKEIQKDRIHYDIKRE